jgi:hypothetical protein
MRQWSALNFLSGTLSPFNRPLRGNRVTVRAAGQVVLVLEVGNEEPFISRPIKGAPQNGERCTEHLLDGQQRLTGLWRGLNNNYEDRTFFLYVKDNDETGMPYFVDSVTRYRREGDKELRPFYANRPEELWRRRMKPLDLCAPGDEAQGAFTKWSKKAIPDRDERDEVLVTRNKVSLAFATFNLPYLSLPTSTSNDTALDVFIKMNTSAAPLSRYDIVVAQVEADMGQSLHDLVGETKQDCPSIAEYYPIEELVLYAGALLQGRPPTNATYMAKDFGQQLLANWSKLIQGVTRTVGFLEEERVYDAARLPTDVVVPVLVALWAEAPGALDAAGQARTLMRKYFWRAAFSNRYEKSTGSRSLVDFNDLKQAIGGQAQSDSVIFRDDLYPLPQLQELVTAGWPKKKDRLGRAILAVALRQGGFDLADGTTVSRANLAKREYHHLFPDAHLKRLGRLDNEIYCSLNCAVVTWQTNRNISDKEPERYLAQRRDGNELGDNEVKARLDSHLIPFEEMVAGDYDKFLAARAAMVYSRMTGLCTGGSK